MTSPHPAVARAALALVTGLVAAGFAPRASRPGRDVNATASYQQNGSVAHDSTIRVSDSARVQIAAARRAVAALATPAAAESAGYRPMFGNVPLQGVHYVRVDLVAGDSFDLARPPVLIFAPMEGTPRLVGAAYAYMHPVDAPPPKGFDGAEGAWHAHERLGWLPGRHLLMMHVWFVEAPEGAFARYNPWLPFYAAGLARPSAAVYADSAAGARERALGLALALAGQPPLLFDMLERNGGDALRRDATARRAAITSLVPRIAAAERAGDRAARDRLAGQATAQADSLVAAYRGAAQASGWAVAPRLVDRTVDEFMGRGHGVEEELDMFMPRGGGAPPPRAHPRM